RGLLGARVEHAAAGERTVRGDLEQERRLADARLAAEQDGGAGNEPAPEHTVELADAGRPPRRLVRVEGGDRPRGPQAAGGDGLDTADDAGLLGCLDHGAPLLALAASAHPAQGR